eukprot:4617374-Prymnesium_polylepis.1
MPSGLKPAIHNVPTTQKPGPWTPGTHEYAHRATGSPFSNRHPPTHHAPRCRACAFFGRRARSEFARRGRGVTPTACVAPRFWTLEVEELLRTKGKENKLQVLVRWAEAGAADSWEPVRLLSEESAAAGEGASEREAAGVGAAHAGGARR